MQFRWLARARSIAIAIAVVLALPIASLHTTFAAPACCCPSPKVCKCPKGSNTPCSINRCHRDAPKALSIELPAFMPQRSEAITVPTRPAIPVILLASQPRPAPTPARPDAPS